MKESTQRILGRVHTEWLTSNMSRAYPLADATGGMTGTLPCRLLTDAFILVYGDVAESDLTVYISKVIHSSTEVIIHLAAKISDQAVVDFGPVAVFDKNSAIGSEYAFELSESDLIVSGKLIAGDLSCCDAIPSTLDLSADTGCLFRGCVRVAPKGLQGLEVDGVVYTGVVELVAGDGVSLDVASGDGRDGSADTIITISVNDYEIPAENKVITTDKQLLTQALELYGAPVRSINGFTPDSSGNIDIVADEQSVTAEEGDNSTIEMKLHVTALNAVEDSSAGSGAIQVTITKPQECEITSVIESLLTMLQQLNQRATALDLSVTEIDTAQANLAARLTGLV